MGSSQVKDELVDLYVSVNKQFYIAGDCVEGEVYLNAKTTRQYSNLCIKFEGVEYVHWTTGSGKNRRSYTNHYKSYEMHNLLVDFHGTVNQGQYVFPFAMMLPTMLCGSFFFSSNCYIKYLMRAELVHATQDKHTQRFQMFLNILEPPRIPLGAVSTTNTINAQCCGCCSDYGTTSITLNSTKNFVVNGDTIGISGMINHSQGKAQIQNWGIALQERRIMVSSGGSTRCPIDHTYPMLVNGGIIQPGTSKQFNINVVIPQNIFSYTAIGRITARYFVLHLSTQYGCCTQPAYAMLHLIVHSRTPMVIQKKQIPQPQNWYPQVYPKLVVQNMKPYIYNPLPVIPFKNLPGGTVVTQNINTEYNQMTQMNQMNQSYQPLGNDFKIPQIQNQFNYNPIFYQQDMFTEAEKQQQGYYQPNFNQPIQQNSQNQLVRKL